MPKKISTKTNPAANAAAPAKARAANAVISGFIIEVGQGAAPVDEGSYPARVYLVAQLGIQPPPAGAQGVPKPQLGIGFELQGATCQGIEPETPPVVSKRYSTSWGPRAALPTLVRAMLGRDPAPGERLDPGDWIGRAVMVAVEHIARADGSMSPRVASVTRCTLKNLPALVTAPLLYPGGCALGDLPMWAQTAIANALTSTAGATAGALPAGYVDDDVPQ